MSDIAKSTQLRFIKTNTPEELTQAVSRLPYRIEIKGGPIKDGKAWILFWIPPEDLAKDPNVKNIDLTGV